MGKAEKLRNEVQHELESLLVAHGFRERERSVFLREGAIAGWAQPVVEPERVRVVYHGARATGRAVTADVTVGARADAVERLHAQIRRERPRRQAPPTHVTRLSLLAPGTHEVRPGGEPWRIPVDDTRRARILQDLAAAFVEVALPYFERLSTLDGLAAEMTAGRIAHDVAWRLPLVHLLRGDPAAAREALEHGTRWAQRTDAAVDADEYRAFATEVLRRLGDATLEATPAAEILDVLRPALSLAYPDRAATILAHLVRSFWWESHPRTTEVGHCALCGTTEAEATLFARTSAALRICDTCVAACRVLIDGHAPGVTVAGSDWRALPPPARRVTAENLAADAVRALRASGTEEALRLVPQVEGRLLRAPADRPPEDVCVVCGPIRAPRTSYYLEERPCSFCDTWQREGLATVSAGRVHVCSDCIDDLHDQVPAERRLAPPTL